MFGSNNNDNKPAEDEQPAPAQDAPAADQPSNDQPANDKPADDQSFLPSVSSDDNSTADETAPAGEETPADEPARGDSGPVVRPSSSAGADDLMQLKREALQQLSPLVGHLDQSPEDRFRTLMMMIQAADDKSLIGDAYEAAQKIEDDKVRAEALLDIVNEINYFTQQDKEAEG